jgi:Flp pilus assembly CpaE family ATPase
VDTAACADPFTAGLLRASDLVVLVVTPELACLGGARRALATLDSLPGGRPRIEMVINRSLGARDIVTRGDVETFLEMRAAAVLPEDTVRCRRLADECKPLSSERSPLAQAVLEFIRALSGAVKA